MRRHDRALSEAAETLRVPPERVPEAVSELRTRARELERAARPRGASDGAIDFDALLGSAVGARRRAGAGRRGAGRRRQDAARPDRPAEGQARRRRDRARERRRRSRRPGRERLADAGRSAACAPTRSCRPPPGWSAEAAAGATRSRAPEAATWQGFPTRSRPHARRSRPPSLDKVMRVLALDYGSARCGCAVSDPTGVLATPIEPVLAPRSKRGLARLRCARPRSRRGDGRRRPTAVAVRCRYRADHRDARVRHCARKRIAGSGRALRRALHHAARGAFAADGRARTRGRPPICSRAGWRRGGADVRLGAAQRRGARGRADRTASDVGPSARRSPRRYRRPSPIARARAGRWPRPEPEADFVPRTMTCDR